MTAVDRFEDAACRKLDLHDVDRLFFGNPGRTSYADAIRVCRTCPVRLECLNAALDVEADSPRSLHHITDVRGGLAPADRLAILRKRDLSCH